MLPLLFERQDYGENMIKLSIVVPVYNMAADGKLEYCLDSLVNQTLAPGSFEIIAVDDCSTDETSILL